MNRRHVLAGLGALALWPAWAADLPIATAVSDAETGRLRRRHGSQFRVLRTDHFTVLSDSTPRYHRVVAGLLEAFHAAVYARFFTVPFEPVDVVVIHDGKAYASYARFHEFDPDGYGVWVPSAKTLYARRYFPDGSVSGVGTLFHEATHAFTAAEGRPPATVLNEGFASVFEQGRVVQGAWAGGNPNPWREDTLIAALDEGRLPTLQRVLALSDEMFRGLSEDRNQAAARSAVLWLWRTDEALLAKWRSTARAGTRCDRALAEVTGRDLDTLDTEWRAFVDTVCRSGALIHRAKGDATLLLEAAERFPSEGLVRWHAADALVVAGRAAEALPHAEAALADPRFPYPGAAWSLVAVARWDADPPGALAALRQAVSFQDWNEVVQEADWTDLRALADHLGDADTAAWAWERLVALRADDSLP